jgi:hypothetical protein
VHHRNGQLLLDLTGELQVGGSLRRHWGDHPRQVGVGADRAPNQAEEVDACPGDVLGDAERLVLLQPGWSLLIKGHARPDDEVGSHRLPYSPNDLKWVAHAVLVGAAVFVSTVIPERRPERVEEVSIGHQFDAVQTGRSASLGGVDEVLEHTIEIPLLGGFGERPVGRFANIAG